MPRRGRGRSVWGEWCGGGKRVKREERMNLRPQRIMDTDPVFSSLIRLSLSPIILPPKSCLYTHRSACRIGWRRTLHGTKRTGGGRGVRGSRRIIESLFLWMLLGCVRSCFSHVQLFLTPWTVAHQAPLSMGFSREEYWSGLPCPPPGDLPNPGIKPTSLTSSALAGGFSLALAFRSWIRTGKIISSLKKAHSTCWSKPESWVGGSHVPSKPKSD